jgi:hypothetical protein
MPNTYKKIASVVVGSGGSSAINFTSIPQTFTDLKMVISARGDASATHRDIIFAFNNSTENFTGKSLYGTGSGVGSNSNFYGTIPAASQTSSVFGNGEIYIPNYTSSNYKTFSGDFVTENNGTQTITNLQSFLWSNTAAVNQITLTLNSGNFIQHTTATLYGIGDVTASKFAKATGGLITYDSTYVYHTFTSSGIFTPNTALTADYLVVAGGGGGGSRIGGGGGAGGFRSTVTATGGGGSLENPLSLSSGSAYTVTVGAGGAGGVSMTGGNGQVGTQGSNSVFSTITSTGGGGGGAYNGLNATGGGSGGGSGSNDGGSTNGAGTANQGYAGGDTTTNQEGAGGGGAGAVGSAGSAGNGGIGGAGVATSITGISVTRAGGGGGASSTTPGAGGSGGGGAGANGNNNATSATVNTGSGGGGARNASDTTNVTAGSGGSGIVIVRYPR